MIRISRKNRTELILALLYTFRFVFKIYIDNNGNYDLFFLLAMTLFFSYGLQVRIFNFTIGVGVLMVSIYLTALFGAPYEVDVFKGVVWIAKIVLCVMCYAIVKQEAYRFNLRKFLDYCSTIFIIQTLISLIYRTSITWRLFENRMELFYLEPSELGAFISVLIIMQAYYLWYDIKNGNSIFCSVRNMIFFCITAAFSQSASMIVYLLIGLLIIFFFDIFTMRLNTSTVFNIILLAILVVVMGSYIFAGDSYLSLRIQGMLNGSDSSFNTRVTNSFETVAEYFENYGLIGCGFGNQISDYGMKFFALKAVNYSTCSSIATFALEGGIFAVIVSVLFIIHTVRTLTKRCDCERIRWALFFFVILYTFGGGYLTNVVIWMLLGLAVSGTFCCDEYGKEYLGNRREC